MKPNWNVIRDEPLTGAENMARDRRLLDELVAGERPATLRFYGWRPACISLGVGQREDMLDLDAVQQAGLDVVRRPTGGQALLHDREITYSVVASQQDPAVGGTLMQSYHAISQALLEGLAALGVAGQGASCEPRPAGGVTPVCFASASAEEVLVGGRKLLASAQWRSRGAFLQHGSLLLEDRQHEIPRFLVDETARGLEPISISLGQILPQLPPDSEIVEAFTIGFSRALRIAFEAEPGA